MGAPLEKKCGAVVPPPHVAVDWFDQQINNKLGVFVLCMYLLLNVDDSDDMSSAATAQTKGQAMPSQAESLFLPAPRITPTHAPNHNTHTHTHAALASSSPYILLHLDTFFHLVYVFCNP